MAGGSYFSMISRQDLNRRFSPPNTTSVSLMSVVKLVRHREGPEEAAPRLSQLLPSQAMGPCTRWATSVKGCSAILAPSKAQPPAAPPGCNCFVQPFFFSAALLLAFLAQDGSSNTSWIVAEREVMRLSCAGLRRLCSHLASREQFWRRRVGWTRGHKKKSEKALTF